MKGGDGVRSIELSGPVVAFFRSPVVQCRAATG